MNSGANNIHRSDLKTYLETSKITETVDAYKVGNKKGTIEVWMSNPLDESETQTGRKLTPMAYDQFINKVNAATEADIENDDCLNYYAVDSSNNIVVAEQTVYRLYEDGDEIRKNINYSVKTFGYKTATAQYYIPVMFFLDINVVVHCTDYVLDLAKQVEDTQVIIMLQDNRTETVKVWEETRGSDENEYTVTMTSVDITNALNPVVTKADTLLYKKEMIYTNKVTVSSSGGTTITKNTYNPGLDKDPEIKIDKFRDTITNSKYIGQNPLDDMESGGTMMFDFMSKNVQNETLEQTLKYILFKITGHDYGVTELPNITIESNFATVGTLKGSTIAEKVWCALKDLGYSDIAAAGAMGNLHYESGGMNPSLVEGGYNEYNGGIGLAQWTNNARGSTGRNTQLRAYAASKGTTWQDEDTQVEFLVGELTKGGGANGYASYELMKSSARYDGVRHDPSEFINAQDVETATKVFCYCFERPGEVFARRSMPERIQYAQSYYEQFKGKTSADFVGSGVGNTEDYAKAEKYSVAGYTFPHYYQGNYPNRTYGCVPKTIKTSGCGPTSMAMIVAGLTGDSSVNPDSFVTALENYFPNYRSYYSPGEGSVYEGICNNNFLQKNYNLKSTLNPTYQQAIAAIEQGKCAIARVPGHVLAIMPVTEEMKAQGYKFYIMDSGSGLDGPYRNTEEVRRAVSQKRPNKPGTITFKAIIEPM